MYIVDIKIILWSDDRIKLAAMIYRNYFYDWLTILLASIREYCVISSTMAVTFSYSPGCWVHLLVLATAQVTSPVYSCIIAVGLASTIHLGAADPGGGWFMFAKARFKYMSWYLSICCDIR